jgi:hypothetical protein
MVRCERMRSDERRWVVQGSTASPRVGVEVGLPTEVELEAACWARVRDRASAIELLLLWQPVSLLAVARLQTD